MVGEPVKVTLPIGGQSRNLPTHGVIEAVASKSATIFAPVSICYFSRVAIKEG